MRSGGTPRGLGWRNQRSRVTTRNRPLRHRPQEMWRARARMVLVVDQLSPAAGLDLDVEAVRRPQNPLPRLVALCVRHVLDLIEPGNRVSHVSGVVQRFLTLVRKGELRVLEPVLYRGRHPRRPVPALVAPSGLSLLDVLAGGPLLLLRRHRTSSSFTGRLRMLPGGRFPTLAASGFLLRRGAALRGVATRARAFAAVLGGVRRVGDLRRPLLGHAFVLQRLVLLLVLDSHDPPPRCHDSRPTPARGAANSRGCGWLSPGSKRRACGYQQGDAGVITRHMHPKRKES